MKKILLLFGISLLIILASFNTTVVLNFSVKAKVMLAILIIIAVFVIDHKIYKKKYTSYRETSEIFNEEYLKEKPSDLNATLASYIMIEFVEWFDITISLLDLVDKGVLKCSLGKDEFDKENFRFRINNNYTDNVLDYERFLINWFKEYGKDDSFSIQDIEANTETYEGAKRFDENCEKWIKLVKQEGDKYINYIKIYGHKVLDNKSYNEQVKWEAFEEYINKMLENDIDIDIEFCRRNIPYVVALNSEIDFCEIDGSLGKDYSLLKGIGILENLLKNIYRKVGAKTADNKK